MQYTLHIRRYTVNMKLRIELLYFFYTKLQPNLVEQIPSEILHRLSCDLFAFIMEVDWLIFPRFHCTLQASRFFKIIDSTSVPTERLCSIM